MFLNLFIITNNFTKLKLKQSKHFKNKYNKMTNAYLSMFQTLLLEVIFLTSNAEYFKVAPEIAFFSWKLARLIYSWHSPTTFDVRVYGMTFNQACLSPNQDVPRRI